MTIDDFKGSDKPERHLTPSRVSAYGKHKTDVLNACSRTFQKQKRENLAKRGKEPQHEDFVPS